MTGLAGKIALVTGSAKNVGRVIASELARRGARVIVNYFHSADAARRMQAELRAEGVEVELIRASVAQPAQVERMFREIEERFGGLDILVNNAASGALLPAGEVTEEAIDRALGTNLKGSLWCSRAAAPLMAKRGGGAIINVSTLGGGNLVMASYLACGPAKAAVEALTRYLAVEYAPLGIRVNTAASGMLASDVADAFPRAAEMQRVVASATPFGRLGRPEELAAVVAFLASDDSRWVTGQLVLADGGLSLGHALLSPPALVAEVRGEAGAEAAAPEPALPGPAHPEPAAAPGPEPVARAAEVEGSPDDVVLVGMGLTVPGANSPAEYWELLLNGPHRFVDVPPDRWERASFASDDRAAEDKTYQTMSAFITGFVPEPGLAAEGAGSAGEEFTTRWLRHALVQALRGVKVRGGERWSVAIGYTPDGSHHLEEASVVAGTLHELERTLDAAAVPEPDRQIFLDEARAALEQRYRRGVGRTSEFLPHRVGRNAVAGLLPPETEVQMVDTACSSSLYAVDIGIKSLMMGKTDVAVCGGAFALGPLGSILFSKLNGLSTGGVVRALDRDSDGVLFADGAALVVLKRRSRAEADGDTILAVLSAFGSSSDGKGKAIYAPSSAGQAIAIRRAFAERPALLREVDWVVAHATGTPAGDLAEFTSLREALAPERPVYVTSNKSVIGHTGWAAGVVSLIQVVLAMREGAIPAQQNFTATPELFGAGESRLTVPAAPVPWPGKGAGKPRVACVSGFGFGGTNAHLVVSEYDATLPASAPAAAPTADERVAVVAWAAHVPGLEERDRVAAWLAGAGAEPGRSWGDGYPVPAFEKIRMPPTSAKAIDRTQLMILACAHDLRAELGPFWEAARPSTGVFVGHMGPTRSAAVYGARCYLDDVRGTLSRDARFSRFSQLAELLDGYAARVRSRTPPSNENTFPGMMPNIIPARVANFFDLHGPNMTLDTGFSSALTACAVAARYLRSGDVELALVGGINGNTTPAMRSLFESAAPDAGAALAEGAFMVALVRESTAREAGLPVLAVLEEGGAPAPGEREVPCGARGAGAGVNYLGAEGGLALLRALLAEGGAAAGGSVRVVCDEDGAGATASLRLASPAAAAAPEVPVPAAAEAAPALELWRHVADFEAHPIERVRAPRAFIPEGAVVVTDRPERLAALGPLPAGAAVLCPEPAPAGAPPRAGVHHLAEITPASVAEALARAGGPPLHLRVLCDLGAAHDPEEPWAPSSARLVALHDLAFLVLQQGFPRMTEEGGSFVPLLLGAGSRGGVHPWAGLFGGLAKTARLEMPAARVFAVIAATDDLRSAVSRVEDEWAGEQPFPVVLYDAEGTRRTMRLREAAEDPSPAAAPRLDEESVVVATAGARGITAELVKALAREFRPHLYLVGSNRLDQFPPEVFQGTDEEFARGRAGYLRTGRAADPAKSVAQLNREFDRMIEARSARRNLDEMIRHCGAGKVHYIACGVLDRDALDGAMAEVLARHGSVDLLVNAAGLLRSAAIPAKTLAGFRSVRDVKLEGYLNLKHAFRAAPPRVWCNFGSLIGLTGQLGEADYASANDFLAMAAAYARTAHQADELTIGWSLWQSVGLGANPVTRAHLEKSGQFSSMSTEEGVHHFLRELARPRHDAFVLPLGRQERAAIEAYYPGFVSGAAEPRPAAPAHAPRHAPARAAELPFYLGSIVSREAGEVVFERVFDLERDGYLAHHLVNGHPTLPGTFMTEIAVEAAGWLFPALHAVAVEEMLLHHFLRVYANRPAPKRIRARVLAAGSREARVHVAVLTDVHSPAGHVLVRDKLHFECTVVLRDRMPEPLHWAPWDPADETPVADPYHFPAAPVRLTGPFVSTTRTRLHPFGKRATYSLDLAADHPAFSSFRVPAILLDGLARVIVLNPLDGGYLPLAAPLSIGRIELYEATSDGALARQAPPIELYVTPREVSWNGGGGTGSHHVAVRGDGTVLLRMTNLRGTVFGYVHQETGAYLSPDELASLSPRLADALVPA